MNCVISSLCTDLAIRSRSMLQPLYRKTAAGWCRPNRHSGLSRVFWGARPLFWRPKNPKKIPPESGTSSVQPFLGFLLTLAHASSDFVEQRLFVSFHDQFGQDLRGIGSPNTTRHGLGRTNHALRGQAAPVPATPTGMTGTSPRRTSAMKPGFKGPICPSLLRVPSGKMPTRNPRFKRSAASRRLDELAASRLTAWYSRFSESIRRSAPGRGSRAPGN